MRRSLVDQSCRGPRVRGTGSEETEMNDVGKRQTKVSQGSWRRRATKLSSLPCQHGLTETTLARLHAGPQLPRAYAKDRIHPTPLPPTITSRKSRDHDHPLLHRHSHPRSSLSTLSPGTDPEDFSLPPSAPAAQFSSATAQLRAPTSVQLAERPPRRPQDSGRDRQTDRKAAALLTRQQSLVSDV